MNIKQKLILAFAVIASLPVILVAVLIILNVHEVLHRADHDRVVSRHWDGADTLQSNCGRGLAPDSGGSATDKLAVPPPSGASPLPQNFVCGLGWHGQYTSGPAFCRGTMRFFTEPTMIAWSLTPLERG